MGIIPAVLAALLDLVLPRTCAGCRAVGRLLCPSCSSVLVLPPQGLTRPRPCPAGLPPVAALGPYEGPLQALLLAHKERAQLGLTGSLGRSLAGVVALLDPGPLVLCPVPSSRAAVRARGYDHAWRLARTAAGELRRQGRPAVASRLLEPARRTADQSGLTSQQRARNMHGALRGTGAAAARVVVVDDVMTTGATLVEATRALVTEGHHVVGAAVLGATVRRSSPDRAFTSSPRAG